MSSSENRKRIVNLKLRCLPEEADQIKEKAIDSGVSISEFLRCAALKRKTRSTIDSQIINELRRLGGLQKHLFTEGGGHTNGGLVSKEYGEILVNIKRAIQRIEG
ncbi:plasmid mobilization protein MobA [Pseudomonas syringae group genomosp. 3]|uniref:Mobilization protein MobB n=1 Tax=Pseudomonas syringae pv. tomato (strain ATCC BAA-871 / DC3000) TaxID=223283 RepID=Q888D4_PSESM|nr:plasmid mobilization protein MobA [Pseudomonas syringae group genomosp. 3]AAO54621.1 mobilization protein MobB [Pseudomonas syringae pv. tomato str. DC3000]KPY97238.1 putative transcriptional regulator [Pseudomonas syringae pv. tomato]